MALDRTPLHPFVAPTGVVLFGASQTIGTLGHGLAKNLLQGNHSGRCHFVNPKHSEVGGHPCHPSLEAVEARLSLALIAAPADNIPEILEACGRRNIRSAIIYSTGFRDAEANGRENLRCLQEIAARKQIRILGPKALGFVLPHSGFNATPIYQDRPGRQSSLHLPVKCDLCGNS